MERMNCQRTRKDWETTWKGITKVPVGNKGTVTQVERLGRFRRRREHNDPQDVDKREWYVKDNS